jgi:polyisoprenoid-binding protein YceI
VKLRNALASLFLFLLLPSGFALAAPETYKIDPGHSNVGFSIRHFFSKVPGRYKTYEGTIVLDPKDLAKTAINVTIDAGSIDTGLADRDKHLASPDFFDTAKFPKITFVSTEVTATGPKKATVKGNLTMKGVTKPVSMEAEILGFSPDPWGGYRGGFEAKTTINRNDFGVSWNKAVEGGGMVLSDEVEIVLNIEGAREAPKAAAPEAAPKKN